MEETVTAVSEKHSSTNRNAIDATVPFQLTRSHKRCNMWQLYITKSCLGIITCQLDAGFSSSEKH